MLKESRFGHRFGCRCPTCSGQRPSGVASKCSKDQITVKMPHKFLPLLRWPMNVKWETPSQKAADSYQGDITATATGAQVWNEFSRRDHLTVKQLFRIIKRTDNTIGLNYVYYVMGQLRRAGLVIPRKHGPETYYDKAVHKQSPELLICRICQGVQPVEMLSPQFLEKVARTHHFRIKMHKLEIRGWCKRCRPGSISHNDFLSE